jgi:hypothetical protein
VDFRKEHMAKKTYIDATGAEVIVDDDVSLLGPHPDLKGTSSEYKPRPDSPNSQRDMRFQPIRFHSPQSPAPKAKSGYGNPMDDLEYVEKFWPSKGNV